MAAGLFFSTSNYQILGVVKKHVQFKKGVNMVGRWIGFLFVLSCILGLAVTSFSADYKPEYKMSIVVGPRTFWAWGVPSSLNW